MAFLKRTAIVLAVVVLAVALAPPTFRNAMRRELTRLITRGLNAFGLFFPFFRHDVDGHNYPRFISEKDVRRGRAYVPANDDIIIATYAASGTHWMQQMVVQVLTNGTMEFDDVGDLGPCLEFPDGTCTPMDAPSVTPRKVLMTHLYADHLDVRPDRASYIIVIRSPLDRLISHYDMISTFLGEGLVAADDMAKDEVFTKSDGWAEWIAGWWALRHYPNVLFVYYEDAKAAHADAIRGVAAFLGVPLDEAGVEIVRERTSIERMRGDAEKYRLRNTPRDGPLIAFVRSGKVDRWRGHLTEARGKEICDEYRKRLQKAGCDFSMDRYKPPCGTAAAA